jgi:hypothetical protein
MTANQRPMTAINRGNNMKEFFAMLGCFICGLVLVAAVLL